MLFAPAVSVVVPVISSFPLSLIAPPALRLRLPLTVEAPRSIAPASFSVTFLPLTMLTAPLKLLLAVSSTMSLPAPAVSEVVPVMASAAVSVMPAALRAALPPTVVVAEAIPSVSVLTTVAVSAPVMVPESVRSFVSFSVTSRALTMLTAPPKLFAPSSTMSWLLPAVSEVVPVMASAAVSVIPAALKAALPPTVVAPRLRALVAVTFSAPLIVPESVRSLVSISVTLLALTMLTAPPKLLLASSTMLLSLPAVREVVPVMVSAPLSPMAPTAVSVKAPPMLAPESVNAPVLRTVAFPLLPLPLLVRPTAPPKVLALPSAIEAADMALVPVTRSNLSVLWVREPVALTERLPPTVV